MRATNGPAINLSVVTATRRRRGRAETRDGWTTPSTQHPSRWRVRGVFISAPGENDRFFYAPAAATSPSVAPLLSDRSTLRTDEKRLSEINKSYAFTRVRSGPGGGRPTAAGTHVKNPALTAGNKTTTPARSFVRPSRESFDSGTRRVDFPRQPLARVSYSNDKILFAFAFIVVLYSFCSDALVLLFGSPEPKYYVLIFTMTRYHHKHQSWIKLALKFVIFRNYP